MPLTCYECAQRTDGPQQAVPTEEGCRPHAPLRPLPFERHIVRPNVLFNYGRVGEVCGLLLAAAKRSRLLPVMRMKSRGQLREGQTALPLLPLLPTRRRHNHSRVSTPDGFPLSIRSQAVVPVVPFPLLAGGVTLFQALRGDCRPF